MFVETKTKTESAVMYQNWNIIHKPGNIVNTNTRGGSLVQMHPKFQLIKANAPAINNPLNECLHFATPFLNERLHIFLIYNHPTSLIEESVFRKAALYKYCIIIGDFNINNKAGKNRLSQFLRKADFQIYQTEPTFIMPNNNDTTPDLIVHSRELKKHFEKVELIPDLGADHLAIEIEMNIITSPKQENTEEDKYRFQKCNTQLVNRIMGEYVGENMLIHEQHITEFNDKLSKTILDNTPKYKPQYYNYELPAYIIQMIKLKRRMYREYKTHKDPQTKKHINALGKNISLMIQQYNEHKWLQTCKEIDESQGKKFYDKLNKVTKYKCRSTTQTITEANKQYITDSEKTEVFADHFQEAFTPELNQNYEARSKNLVDKWYDGYFSKSIGAPDIEIEESDYFELLSRQKNTSAGHDNIPWLVFKKLDSEIHKHVLKIFNFCINNGFIPQTWKTGNITVIHKPNTDPKKTRNYRPITLLPVMGKLFEKIIRKLLTTAASKNIPNFQYGFKQKHSTTHPLTILASNIQTTRLNHQHTAALFLDINKAFDSVWHRGMLFKLAQMNVPRYLILLIKSFLEHRTLRIKINNTLSKPFIPLQGVPQGSPLSPLLYNLYCYDIFSQTDPNNYLLQYADDTALVTHAKSINIATEKLQSLITTIESWFNRWRLKPNPDKSQFIIFFHTPKSSSPTVRLANIAIKPVNSIKYLGVQIDHKLNFKQHSSITKKRAVTRARYFRSLTYKKHGIDLSTAGTIYKTICRPLLEYSHPIFINCGNSVKKTIQTTETMALRSITKLRHPDNPIHNPPNYLLYQTTKTVPILDRLGALFRKFARTDHNMDLLKQMCIGRTSQTTKYKNPEKTIFQHLQEISELD